MKKSSMGILCFFACLAVILSNGQLPEWDDPFGQYPQWDVPYVPTPYEVVDVMLEMAGVTDSDTLYDLGCGDGRIVITAATRLGTKGIGIDIDPERIKECHTNAAEAGVEDHVTFLNQNLFETDFSRASVVTLYLLNSVNLRLRPKLLKDLKPGTRIVSHDFSMGSWKADKKTDISVDYRVHEVYFWTIPANASGRWRVNQPPQLMAVPFTLNIKQQFQEIEGQADLRKAVVPIQDVELKGDQISFTLITDESHTCTFQGKISGHRMEGRVTVRTEDKDQTFVWKAERDPKTMLPLDPGNQDGWD
jgi:SAM-dependent methyltransferase